LLILFLSSNQIFFF